MAPPSTHPSTRFWDKVNQAGPDECWEWTGARHPLGYGFLYGGRLYGGKRWAKAHRLSWEIHYGPIPERKHVLHDCDNPPCVNPRHLYVGTQRENNRDRGARKRGRENRAENRGELSHLSKLTETEVRAIMAELESGSPRTQQAIADAYGTSQKTVSSILHRRTWGHLWRSST